MHGSKRWTLAAFALWGFGMLVGSVAPWDVLDGSRASLDETRRIAASMGGASETPRVLLIGSSPVELGLSAERISAATGLPAFNLAAGGALSFFPEYLNQVLLFVQPDDVVILSNPNWVSRNGVLLAEGCVSRFSLACASLRPHPLPHLIEFLRVVSGHWSSATDIMRNDVGDVVSYRSTNAAVTISTIPFPGGYANDAVAELRQAVAAIRAKGACPLLTLGPVYVDARDEARWLREQQIVEARIAKLGLASSVITDGAISTDRSLFLDGYEHPAASEGAIWTDRVIGRLTSPSQGPCAGSLAKAGRPPARS
ncbi:hypothetical protein GCM10011611_06480 [Aliidongia dinghuensis]|uniref:Uncharacterized protein n=1 Tax=Aliidongia dinghuensis TaxID=1867774 RepID=A0A8J2YQ92_9PROT|nr:hypothetical protein [Aliidongia dinghuensis]GGF03727.1 hypothetical protein GCM10011611_06480 [Aliidongia dinghuensis]